MAMRDYFNFKKQTQPETLYEKLRKLDPKIPYDERSQLEQKIVEGYNDNSCVQKVLSGETTFGNLLSKLEDKEFKNEFPDEYKHMKEELTQVLPEKMIDRLTGGIPSLLKRFGVSLIPAAGVVCVGIASAPYTGIIGSVIGIYGGLGLGIYGIFKESHDCFLSLRAETYLDSNFSSPFLSNIQVQKFEEQAKEIGDRLDENLKSLKEGIPELKKLGEIGEEFAKGIEYAKPKLEEFKKCAKTLLKAVNSLEKPKKPSVLEQHLKDEFGKPSKHSQLSNSSVYNVKSMISDTYPIA